MKLVGFIKEYNQIKEAISLTELVSDNSELYTNSEKVINYLNNGVLLLGWMGYFIDVKSKKLIAPDSYHTDGIWVWPSYYTYYLEMYPFIKINPEFLAHMEGRNFEMNVDANFDNRKIKKEEELSLKLSTKS